MGTTHSPPGPEGRFLGGNVREYARDPLGFLSRCVREYGDVVELRFMGQTIYLLADPGLIEYVLVENARNFTKTRSLKRNQRLLGEGLLSSESEFWRRQQRLAGLALAMSSASLERDLQPSARPFRKQGGPEGHLGVVPACVGPREGRRSSQPPPWPYAPRAVDATSRTLTNPSGPTRTRKGSTVVAIGVDRLRVGRDNGARRRLPCAAEDNQAGVLQR